MAGKCTFVELRMPPMQLIDLKLGMCLQGAASSRMSSYRIPFYRAWFLRQAGCCGAARRPACWILAPQPKAIHSHARHLGLEHRKKKVLATLPLKTAADYRASHMGRYHVDLVER